MLVKSSRVGEIELQAEEIICFADGVLGLPEWKEAVILPVENIPLLSWLQFLHDEDAAFLLLDVVTFFPAYDVEQAKQHAGLEGEDQVVRTIVRIPGEDFSQATTNLIGPIVVAGGQGRQVVLHDSGYPLRQPLFGGS